MPGGDDGAVVLVIKRGAAEVHHSDGRALHAPLVPLLREGERHRLLRSSAMQAQPLPPTAEAAPREGKASEGTLAPAQPPDPDHRAAEPAVPTPSSRTTRAVHAGHRPWASARTLLLNPVSPRATFRHLPPANKARDAKNLRANLSHEAAPLPFPGCRRARSQSSRRGCSPAWGQCAWVYCHAELRRQTESGWRNRNRARPHPPGARA